MKPTPFLNLLSPDRKRQLQQLLVYRALQRSSLFLLFFLFIVTIILWGSTYTLEREREQQHARTRETEIQLSGKNGSSLDQQILDFNTFLTTVRGLQVGYTRWTPILSELLSQLPAGIVLAQLELQSDTKTLLLRGTAAQRDDLLQLEDALSRSRTFQNPTAPISNLLQKEGIDFEIHATLLLQ
ncbi:MAG: PilN domain-containing protein [bacterium]